MKYRKNEFVSNWCAYYILWLEPEMILADISYLKPISLNLRLIENL
ncbi:hypothetical protein D1AOALGA4SA_11489 [Olavius algarvensis Delta 1 endosymbiont]|nr:hypothetical protein D1AOALGA4SA_11489 [Olavius algarvensis Delta 1 endosymbiont]